jgi:hypothetical protein
MILHVRKLLLKQAATRIKQAMLLIRKSAHWTRKPWEGGRIFYRAVRYSNFGGALENMFSLKSFCIPSAFQRAWEQML